jgi:hypothetical protein
MPRGDRTGPQGQGPMTGRGRGKCNPNDRASTPREQAGMGSGRKADRNRGQGSGRRAGRGQAKGRGRRS